MSFDPRRRPRAPRWLPTPASPEWVTGNVLRVVTARFVSRVGGVAGFFVGIWGKLAYELDATPAALALVMATIGVSGIVGSALAGVLVDRHDPRRVVIVSELAFVPSILALVAADSTTAMAALLVPASVSGTMVFTAVAAFPPFLTRDPLHLERVNAAVEAAGTLAFVAGPAAGALLVHVATVDAVFVLDAVTSLVAVALVRSVSLAARDTPGQYRRGLHDLLEGLRFSWSDPVIRLLSLAAGLTFLSFGMFGALEPLFFRDVLETGPEMLGYVNSLFGAGLLVGSVVYARLPPAWTSLRAAAWFTAAAALGAAAYTAGDRLPFVLAGAAYWSVMLGILMPLQRTLAHLRAPEDLVGRVMGTFGVLNQAGELVPLTVAPALAAAIGVQATLVGAGLVIAAVALPLIPVAGRQHDLVVAGAASSPTRGSTPAATPGQGHA